MELKKTNDLTAPAETKVPSISDRKEPNKYSVYDILIASKEDTSEQNIENKIVHKDHEKPIFSDVSTLDWLKTWRSLEVN